jgi:hypothetical protein
VNFDDYINSSDVSMFNYYTMVFSRNYIHKGMEPIKFKEKHYEIAKMNLSLFDHIVVLENKGHMNALTDTLGWTNEVEKEGPIEKPISVRFISWIMGWKDDPSKKKTTKNNPYLAVEMLKRGKLFLFLKYIKHPKVEPDQKFKDKFNSLNKWDNKLYQDAKDLSKFSS